MPQSRSGRACVKCGKPKAEIEFSLSTKRGGVSYRTKICKECLNASRRKPKPDPMYCKCGNTVFWYDAIDFATGSTWHLCRYCGLLLPVKSTWRTNYQALQWVG